MSRTLSLLCLIADQCVNRSHRSFIAGSIRLAIPIAMTAMMAASAAKAGIVTEYTNDSTDTFGYTIIAPPSTLGASFNLDGISAVTITLPNTPILSDGFIVVDSELDNTGTGTIQLDSADLNLQNFVYSSNLGSLGSVQVTGNNVHIDVTSGPIEVTNGNFDINSSISGRIFLDGGSLTLTGTLLGVPVNTTEFLQSRPVGGGFTGVGTNNSRNGDDGVFRCNP